MLLSQLRLLGGERLIRDAEFGRLGMVRDPANTLFVPADSAARLKEAVENKGVAAIVTSEDLIDRVPGRIGLVASPNPVNFLFRSHLDLYAQGFLDRKEPNDIARSATIHPTASIADRNVIIGERTIIGPNVSVLGNTVIGDDCVIGPGVVLGGNGFEVREIDGVRRVVPHTGGVRLGDRVELQANTCVTRSAFGGYTEIGDGTATDNLVHIAHNARIGRNCRLAAAAMVAGSTVLEDDVWVGPNATISNGLTLGSGCQISLGAVVIKDVDPGQKVSGNFAIEHKSFLRFFKLMRSQ